MMVKERLEYLITAAKRGLDARLDVAVAAAGDDWDEEVRVRRAVGDMAQVIEECAAELTAYVLASDKLTRDATEKMFDALGDPQSAKTLIRVAAFTPEIAGRMLFAWLDRAGVLHSREDVERVRYLVLHIYELLTVRGKSFR